MNNRSLADRLRKLESRLAPTPHPAPTIIKFVEPGGEVTATLRFENGQQTWWHAPGYEPLDSAAARHAPETAENAQMSADILR